MKKMLMLSLVLLFVASQFVPVERTNPPVTSEVPANPEAKAILKRACYNCHSNETNWPWYSYIAPVSMLVTDDVGHARYHINFSEWNKYDPVKQRDHLEEIVEQVEEGEMPLWYYLPLHPSARIQKEDLEVLRKWAHSFTTTNSAKTSSAPESHEHNSSHQH